MSQAVACINAGSSSIKFALFMLGKDGVEPAGAGKIEGIGTAPHLIAREPDGRISTERRWPQGAALSHEALFGDLLGWMREHLTGQEVIGIGHRVVHGGTHFFAPAIVDDALLEALDALSPLAPLHQPHNLAAIRAIRAVAPDLPQVACFDTAFHHGHADLATRFALPRALHDEGVRRYGFHGLSYDYVSRRLRELDPGLAAGRVIAAHLGNGASLCAMLAGTSVDSSMGFTALEGLMMGTRCGTLDPGVILYLLQQKGVSAAEVEDLLYHRSGLLGVSGISGDMRDLLASADPHAREAIDLFTWRIAREAGALVSTLGGLDGIVFTAGIGENAPQVRALVCERLAWLGIELDHAANRGHAPLINTSASRVAVRVIPTDEERMIALHMINLLLPTREEVA
ncbi:acetate/propionate family kinase [Sphingomonas sp. TDK1]|uniref:acetate/propionate family kinase n=1 Tax=Sphingomonas sp. TDK1 TaxID=453247 RepID=UPI0007D95DD1|nr:acetate/propionate family kinase [Sphingomonas sp. TDK1]OAN64929.1 acetate kinase [Sphingomonas sp. TDK1]